MADTAYCYTCNVHHPIEEMRQIMTGRGRRWRCIATIKATKQTSTKRQEFGAQMKAKKTRPRVTPQSEPEGSQ